MKITLPILGIILIAACTTNVSPAGQTGTEESSADQQTVNESAPLSANGQTFRSFTAFFGPDGLVEGGAGALAALLPYEAPGASLKLTDEKVQYLGGGEYSITRTVRNTGAETVSFNDVLKVHDLFSATHFTIPCVNYNGNDFDGGETIADGVRLGKVKVPTGISCEGEPWIVSYQRTGVPACTLTENAETGLALFASNDTPSSLVSSCALEQASDGRYTHVIVRPIVEAPYTYESKGVFGPRYEEKITLAPGESFTATSYLCVCPPRWENYSTVSLMEHALKLLDTHLDICMSDRQAWDLGQRYVRSLLYLYKGKWLFSTNRKQRMFHAQHKVLISREEMAERQKWEYWTDIATFDPSFEIGWAGQNFLCARMIATQSFLTGDTSLLTKAYDVYEAFLGSQRRNGLLHVRYDQNYAEDEKKINADVCNLGWGSAEAVRMYKLLKEHGIEKPEYLDFARRINDFFISKWDDSCGFGKTWTLKGKPVQRTGTIGGFMIPALAEFYEVTGEKKYLDYAVKASDLYYERDLNQFICTAGAIDCNCIDKETSYPFLQGSLTMYRITKDPKYLERAEKAAAYFSSWMFFFDPLFAPETDMYKYNWHPTGGTGVSAEHQCIDAWGGIMAADMYELSQLTGNPMWDRLGRLMWANAVQGITTRLGEFFHDMQRPIGSQNEGFFQARFTKYRPVIEAGYWNDIFVSWPPAYRLWTLDRMRRMGVTMCGEGLPADPQEMTLDGTMVRSSVADPCIIFDNGEFYLTGTGSSKLYMVKDSSIARLGREFHRSDEHLIYDSTLDPTVQQLFGEGALINGCWSPEIHYFSEEEFPGYSGWYLYFGLKQQYTDLTGSARNIRMCILKSASGRVDGPYVSPVTGVENQSQPLLDADGGLIPRWAVGPSVLRVPQGKHKGTYLTWVEESGRGEGYGKFYQKLMISHFVLPWQLSGKPGIITTPTQEWETHGADERRPMVVEGGTAVYGDDGEVFLTYCGSGYWSDYGIGQLTLKRQGRHGYADPLKTESWIKYEGNPVFSSVDSGDLRGAGHGFFLRDAAGGRFICYHAYPYVGGEKIRMRNAYIEPYRIDKAAACPSAPEGVIRIGALGTGVTAPVGTPIPFRIATK